MREIILDTETTGLDPAAGHRIVELACLELINHMPTGRTFREYLNPERPMPEEAQRIHGLSDAFLADKPRFAEIADAFLQFIGDAPLVIHNAEFDIGFLNAELRLIGKPELEVVRATDTVLMARQRFPGAQAGLDALCRRLEIDNSARSYHGALLDCELLAAVYLELCGGRQPGLALVKEAVMMTDCLAASSRPPRPPRPHAPTVEELLAHDALLNGLTDPVWRL